LVFGHSDGNEGRINGWIEANTRQGKPKHWKTKDVRGAGYIPTFLGANCLDGWPEASLGELGSTEV